MVDTESKNFLDELLEEEAVEAFLDKLRDDAKIEIFEY